MIVFLTSTPPSVDATGQLTSHYGKNVEEKFKEKSRKRNRERSQTNIRAEISKYMQEKKLRPSKQDTMYTINPSKMNCIGFPVPLALVSY